MSIRIVLLFLFLSPPLRAEHDEMVRPWPDRQGKRRATVGEIVGDVKSCFTAIEIAVVLFAKTGPLQDLAGEGIVAAKNAHTKIITLIADKGRMKKGRVFLLEGVAAWAGVVKLKPQDLLEMTYQQVYEWTFRPLWNQCKNMVADLKTLRTLPDLTVFVRNPDFYLAREGDGTGIRNGKYCAEKNLGLFGGRLSGCKTCCDRQLHGGTGLTSYLTSCKAVCNAQFD